MVMEASDLNDSQILQSTVQESGEDGKVRYSTQLPSGRPLTSEWMRPEDMKGSIVIKWCDHVRQQAAIDVQEEQAKKRRGSVEPEDIASEVRQESLSDVTDPVEFARHQRDMYLDRVNVLEQRINDMKAERTTMRSHYEQWEKVVITLRGEHDE